MKKYLVISLLFIFMISCGALAIGSKQNSKAPKVQSTEGIEVSQQDSKNISSAKADKKDARQKAKKRNKFVRNLHKIERYENNKRIKQRDKAFYESRLNLKKHKLEELEAESKEKTAEENQNSENTENTENTENETDNTDNKSEENREKGEN